MQPSVDIAGTVVKAVSRIVGIDKALKNRMKMELRIMFM